MRVVERGERVQVNIGNGVEVVFVEAAQDAVIPAGNGCESVFVFFFVEALFKEFIFNALPEQRALLGHCGWPRCLTSVE